MEKTSLITNLQRQEFSENIVRAFEKVQRGDFVPDEYKKYAYDDVALPIGEGATISQPSTIAFMLNLLELKKGQKVLELGSGSGYVLALINEMTHGGIFGVEIIPELAKISEKLLEKHKNIRIINKSGKNGLVKYAPYDRILISASMSAIPQNIAKQLKSNGILVVPVGESIIKVRKIGNRILTEEFPGFVFVPFVDVKVFDKPHTLVCGTL